MGDQNVHRLVDQVGPPVAAGLVGDLHPGQSAHGRHEQVECPLAAQSGGLGHCAGRCQGGQADGQRFRGRDEGRYGPLEQQLVTERVLNCGADKGPGTVPQRLPGGVAGRAAAHGLGKLPHPLRIHGVVKVILRWEIGVQGRRPHPDPCGQLAQGQGGNPLCPDELPGCSEDLGSRPVSLAAPDIVLPIIVRKFYHSTVTLTPLGRIDKAARPDGNDPARSVGGRRRRWVAPVATVASRSPVPRAGGWGEGSRCGPGAAVVAFGALPGGEVWWRTARMCGRV
jgi:hypothetical protein